MGPMGEAFSASKRSVLLIDEIDKADLEFPNDLLHELDAMSFLIPETQETITAKERPVVIITSNSEKELPDAFLRRVVYHFISFPTTEMMARIVEVHFPKLGSRLLENAIKAFYKLRQVDGLRKRPSTSELIDWVAALLAHGVDPDDFSREIPFMGTLIKREQDFKIVKQRGSSR